MTLVQHISSKDINPEMKGS